MVGCKVCQLQKIFVVVDYNVLIIDCCYGIDDLELVLQVEMFVKNVVEFGVEYYFEFDMCQGVVYIVGLEQGFILLGMIIVCGDSYILIYGVFGLLVYGIGIFEVEYVLVIQILIQKKVKNMLVKVNGQVLDGVIVKDIVLVIIGKIGIVGGMGYVIEYVGEVIEFLLIEGCMMVCNMLIEVGVCVGLIVLD